MRFQANITTFILLTLCIVLNENGTFTLSDKIVSTSSLLPYIGCTNFFKNRDVDFVKRTPRLRGGRSKRGGRRVKAALEDAQKRGSNSTAAARFPVGKWTRSSPILNISKASSEAPILRNSSTDFQSAPSTLEMYKKKKKKPLSNRQLANKASARHRHVPTKKFLLIFFMP